MSQLDKDIDRLKKHARAHTVRVFGLPERTSESSENICEHVIRNVLEAACPTKSWESNDIKRAYRVATGTIDSQSPVLMVRLRCDDDKSKIFEVRGLLRDQGNRVAK